MKILVLGASGRSGFQIIRRGIAEGHEITAFVRSRDKLVGQFAGKLPSGLTVITGDASEETALTAAMTGKDIVINAAGNAWKPEGYADLVAGIIRAADKTLGPNGRFWFFGSSSALDVPGTRIMSADLPRMPALLQAHKSNYETALATGLDWSMICPGPMTTSASGAPHTSLQLSQDVWPFERPGITKFLPRIALSIALKNKTPALTVYYEDAAKVILDNLESNGPLSRKRVGIAWSAANSAN